MTSKRAAVPFWATRWLGAISGVIRGLRGRDAESALLFYDGDCGLCNASVTLTLDHGPPAGLRYASQESERFVQLVEHEPWVGRLDTLVVELGERDAVLIRSQAVFWLVSRLRGPIRLLSLFVLVPSPLIDFGYRVVARNRRRVSGLFERACRIPTEEEKRLFVDGWIRPPAAGNDARTDAPAA